MISGLVVIHFTVNRLVHKALISFFAHNKSNLIVLSTYYRYQRGLIPTKKKRKDTNVGKIKRFLIYYYYFLTIVVILRQWKANGSEVAD